MKLKTFLVSTAISSFLISNTTAQEGSSIIYKTREEHKIVYYQNGRIINQKEVEKALKLFPDSKKEIRTSSFYSKTAAIFVIPGMVMVAGTFAVHPIWWAGEAIAGSNKDIRKTEAVIGLTGLGLIIVGLPFIRAYDKHLSKSINLYNNHFPANNVSPSILTIGLNGNGAGIVIRF
jgi:hypothetical protein